MKKFVVLHNIRSAHNVGAVFRTADGAGVSKIFLTGYTPTPVDRFGRVQTEIEKTSLGAVHVVEWEHNESIEDVLEHLRKEGVEIVAIEQHSRSAHYYTHRPSGDVAYIFGNEVEGIPNDVCRDADAVLEIPMLGLKESLNVSVTAGIILYKDTA